MSEYIQGLVQGERDGLQLFALRLHGYQYFWIYLDSIIYSSLKAFSFLLLVFLLYFFLSFPLFFILPNFSSLVVIAGTKIFLVPRSFLISRADSVIGCVT